LEVGCLVVVCKDEGTAVVEAAEEEDQEEFIMNELRLIELVIYDFKSNFV